MQEIKNGLKVGSLFAILFFIIIFLTRVFQDELGSENIAILFLTPALITALRGNLKYTIILAFFGIFLFNFFFLEPLFIPSLSNTSQILNYFIFLGVGIIIALQARNLKNKSKKLEEEFVKNELLKESQELKATLLSSVSHDLKTPLSSILGSACSLRDSYQNMEKKSVDELFDTIIVSSKNMERLVTNLLDSARLEQKDAKLKLSTCCLEDIFEVSIRDFEGALKDRNIEIDLQEGCEFLNGDCILLEQVIKNILENAIKYSLDGSGIYIKSEQADENIKISIKNIGTNIPENELENIFEKFYRIKNMDDKSGSGIGLYICKIATKLHGGKISAKNCDDGVVFEIELPKSPKNQDGAE